MGSGNCVSDCIHPDIVIPVQDIIHGKFDNSCFIFQHGKIQGGRPAQEIFWKTCRYAAVIRIVYLRFPDKMPGPANGEVGTHIITFHFQLAEITPGVSGKVAVESIIDIPLHFVFKIDTGAIPVTVIKSGLSGGCPVEK